MDIQNAVLEKLESPAPIVTVETLMDALRLNKEQVRAAIYGLRKKGYYIELVPTTVVRFRLRDPDDRRKHKY